MGKPGMAPDKHLEPLFFLHHCSADDTKLFPSHCDPTVSAQISARLSDLNTRMKTELSKTSRKTASPTGAMMDELFFSVSAFKNLWRLVSSENSSSPLTSNSRTRLTNTAFHYYSDI